MTFSKLSTLKVRAILRNSGAILRNYSDAPPPSVVKDGIADGVYVYTLHIDYGTNARACSERFVVKVCGNSAQLCAIRCHCAQFGAIPSRDTRLPRQGGRIVTVYQETGLVSECEKMVRCANLTHTIPSCRWWSEDLRGGRSHAHNPALLRCGRSGSRTPRSG